MLDLLGLYAYFFFLGTILAVLSCVNVVLGGRRFIFGIILGVITMLSAGVLLAGVVSKTSGVYQEVIIKTGHIVKVSTTGKDEFEAWVKITYEDGKFEKVELINGTVVPFANASGR